jgi:AbrB family looped-hinge helix DNA binding protein
MATSTVSTKGQIVIPARVRTELGIEAGSRIEFVRTDEGWLIKPAILPVTALKGLVKGRAAPVAISEMRRIVRKRARR